MFKVVAIPALQDNYIWIITHNDHCVVVDPGDAAPVTHFINQQQLKLDTIIITHHHHDHTGGLPALIEHYQPKVIGPSSINEINHPVTGGDTIVLLQGALTLAVIATPGHTLDHLCYANTQVMFCGDTLFACGCGRLFEGNAEQMLNSLCKLLEYPDGCKVYCAHEYTHNNVQFALENDPDNNKIIEYLRAIQHKSHTLPTTIRQEKQLNPFVKICCSNHSVTDKISKLLYLRKLKDNWQPKLEKNQ